MTSDERQFLHTAAWMFIRHGRRDRAIGVCEALCEDDPRDGAAAAALAELLLDSGDTARALELLRSSEFPPGRAAESAARWKRYLESRKGAERKWT